MPAPAPGSPSASQQTPTTSEPSDRYASTTLPSPVGEVLVAFSEHGVTLLAAAENPEVFQRRVAERTGRPAVPAAEAPPWLAGAVGSADGTGVAFDLRGLTRFEAAVLRETAKIPPGEVRPYAWVAAAIGQPNSVRAVGAALGRNPVPILIPCHRVVRTDGTLGGYALGMEHKRALLTFEGVNLARLERLARGRIRFVGIPSGSYCYPTCANARRTPLEQQAPYVIAPVAVAAGYQPCDRCRSDLS